MRVLVRNTVILLKWSRVAATEILPTLEKFGTSCQLVLQRQEVYFMQEPLQTGGGQVVWRVTLVRLICNEVVVCMFTGNEVHLVGAHTVDGRAISQAHVASGM